MADDPHNLILIEQYWPDLAGAAKEALLRAAGKMMGPRTARAALDAALEPFGGFEAAIERLAGGETEAPKTHDCQ